MPYLRPKRRISFPINIWPGKGERGQESQREGASSLGLFALPGQSGSNPAQLTTGTDRLISTWSCRNPIRGLRSVGQPRHVNLFSMCAAARRSQTTGAQEARPQPQPQPQPRSSGGVNKELKASKCIELARAAPGRRPQGGGGCLWLDSASRSPRNCAHSEPGARASRAPVGRGSHRAGRVGKRRGGGGEERRPHLEHF